MTRPLLPRLNRFSRKTLIATVLGLGLVGGCQVSKPAPPTTTGMVPPGSFTLKWNAPLDLKNDVVSDVYVREDVVIAYTRQHYAYILDREAGTLKWAAQVTRPGEKVRPPVVLKDYIVFPTISTMEIYDRKGKNHRSVPTGGLALRSGAVGLGTHAYFGADAEGGGKVINLDLAGSQYQSASVRWGLQTRGGLSATPAIHQGLLYVGDDVGDVYAVNADTRAPIWAMKEQGREEGVFGAGAGIRADVKADDYGVYVASMDTKLYCLGRTDGRIRWQFFAGQALLHSPVATATTVYQYIEGTGIVAIEKIKGPYNRTPMWTVADAVQFLAEDDKYTYLERKDHSIVAVERATGQTKFQSRRNDFVAFGSALKNNVIFAASKDGVVHAVIPVLKAGSVGEMVLAPASGDAIASIR